MIALTKTKEQAENISRILLSDGARAAWIQGLEFMNMYKGKARAYTNIALIKYWGKQDETFILPMNNSLSLTLDAFTQKQRWLFHPILRKIALHWMAWCKQTLPPKSCGLLGSGTKSGLPVVCHGGKSKLRPNRCWTCLFC